VDWSKIASNILYPVVWLSIEDVGDEVGKFLVYLKTSRRGSYADMHCIGHSLGAHVCNNAAKYVGEGELARVTNLDPASVTGTMDPIKGIAKFTDIIHTSDMFADNSRLADADFYPNGGGSQKCDQSKLYQYSVYQRVMYTDNSYYINL
jgi:Ser-tRNA(Ala) deacylase AlaX